MKKAQSEIISGKEGWLNDVSSAEGSSDTLEPKTPLKKQWCLQKEELKITRKMAHPLFDEKLFSMQIGEWSQVIRANGGPYFYKVLETFVDTSDVSAKMEEGRAILGREAKAHLVKELLEKIRVKETALKDGS